MEKNKTAESEPTMLIREETIRDTTIIVYICRLETSNTGSQAGVLPEISAPRLLSTDTLDGALSASSQVLVIIIEFLNLLTSNITQGGDIRDVLRDR